MSVLIPFLAVQAIVGGQGQASAGDLSGFYNPRREITFSGTVTGKTKGRAPGYAEGMSILVRTGKQVREVELGPTWYVGRQQAALKLGDKVKVTGVPLVLDGRQKVTVARQIVRGRQILALRDNAGMPYWDVRRSGQVASNMGTRYQGRINRANTYMINGEQYAGYVVDTDNGPIDVAVAPSWYWNNQPNLLNSGTNVTLYGNGPAVRTGGVGLGGRGGVILLNSATYDGGTVLLNQGGLPFYGYGGFRSYP